MLKIFKFKNNEDHTVNLLTSEEMVSDIKNLYLSSSDLKKTKQDIDKEIEKNIPKYEKINFEGKSYFYSKENLPLIYKENITSDSNSSKKPFFEKMMTYLIISPFILFPISFNTLFLYIFLKNRKTKQLLSKNKTVKKTFITKNTIEKTIYPFLYINLFYYFVIAFFHIHYIYLLLPIIMNVFSLVLAELIQHFDKNHLKYDDIKNFTTDEFEILSASSIETKINEMEPKNLILTSSITNDENKLKDWQKYF